VQQDIFLNILNDNNVEEETKNLIDDIIFNYQE
jgi:hypothetical protein